MDNHKFGEATAKSLFMRTSWPCGKEPHDAWDIREGGVRINEGFRAVSPCETVFDWTPAYDMDWPGSPDPMDAPLLPIPFTANELAACMLDGIGVEIQQHLDRRIGYALDDEALAGFGLREREVRDALRDAYALAAKAQLQVGEFDYDEQEATYALRSQLDDAEHKANEKESVFEDGITNQEATQRRERAVANVADLNARTKQANAAIKAKWFAWRKAMVRQLLQPQQPDTQPQAGNDAPVVDLPDPERRLAALRALGGSAKWKRNRDGVQAWKFTGITKLVAQEKADRRKRSDEKTIRPDLTEAAEAESMEKRNGPNK